MDKLELFHDLARQLEDDGYEVTVHDDYSGRCMYGETVPALSGDFPPGALAGAALQVCADFDYSAAEVRDLLPHRQDSLGRGVIVY